MPLGVQRRPIFPQSLCSLGKGKLVSELCKGRQLLAEEEQNTYRNEDNAGPSNQCYKHNTSALKLQKTTRPLLSMLFSRVLPLSSVFSTIAFVYGFSYAIHYVPGALVSIPNLFK